MATPVLERERGRKKKWKGMCHLELSPITADVDKNDIQYINRCWGEKTSEKKKNLAVTKENSDFEVVKSCKLHKTKKNVRNQRDEVMWILNGFHDGNRLNHPSVAKGK